MYPASQHRLAVQCPPSRPPPPPPQLPLPCKHPRVEHRLHKPLRGYPPSRPLPPFAQAARGRLISPAHRQHPPRQAQHRRPPRFRTQRPIAGTYGSLNTESSRHPHSRGGSGGGNDASPRPPFGVHIPHGLARRQHPRRRAALAALPPPAACAPPIKPGPAELAEAGTLYSAPRPPALLPIQQPVPRVYAQGQDGTDDRPPEDAGGPRAGHLTHPPRLQPRCLQDASVAQGREDLPLFDVPPA
eukprot:scaffold3457_cov118-Isochrysis_galbana.AAC.3